MLPERISSKLAAPPRDGAAYDAGELDRSLSRLSRARAGDGHRVREDADGAVHRERVATGGKRGLDAAEATTESALAEVELRERDGGQPAGGDGEGHRDDRPARAAVPARPERTRLNVRALLNWRVLDLVHLALPSLAGARRYLRRRP